MRRRPSRGSAPAATGAAAVVTSSRALTCQALPQAVDIHAGANPAARLERPAREG